ncbi:hypothetical protein BBJ28_00010433 [Nothophytophthora sp. Chile5]|nr:hypothetical protein BBJ28_00010433 [Nothophytophthora sp. Chile5]
MRAALLGEPTVKRRAGRGDEDAAASARDCKRLKAGDANMVKWEPERWEQAEAENDDDDVPLARYQRPRPRPPKAKEQAKKTMRKPQEQETTFELSAKRRVLVRKWKNLVLVDIREFYDDDGIAKPSKKGSWRLSLSLEQWHKLVELSDAVSEAIQLVEENRIRKDSLVDVPGRIPKPGGDSRAIAFPLSAKRRVTVRFFRASVLIDLREFYEQDGVAKPGKKGIALSKDQWVSLQEVAEDISDAVGRL